MSVVPAGHVMPFFDRLSGEPAVAEYASKPDVGSLRDSLSRDLARLFNVRNGLTIEQFLDNANAAPHYGLPDIIGVSPQSAIDLQRLERVIHRAISTYEPRLVQVLAQAKSDPSGLTATRVVISAVVVMDRQPCQIHFDIVLNSQYARLSTDMRAVALEPQQ